MSGSPCLSATRTSAWPPTAFSSGTWSRSCDQSGDPHDRLHLTGGYRPCRPTTLTGRVSTSQRRRLSSTRAATPPSGRSATFENANASGGNNTQQSDNPPVLIGDITNPSATITFVDAGGNSDSDASPAERNRRHPPRPHHISRQRHQVHRRCRADLLRQPDSRHNDGERGGQRLLRTDRGHRRLHPPVRAASIANNGFLTVQFNTTPNCVSGTYSVATTPRLMRATRLRERTSRSRRRVAP